MFSFFKLFDDEPDRPDKQAEKVASQTKRSVQKTIMNIRDYLKLPDSCVKFLKGVVFWAFNNMPAKEAVKHYLVVGSIGSGKTTIIRQFLQSIAPRFKKNRKRAEQLIIYDGKGDMIPILAGLGLHPDEENVWILSPLDERGCEWQISDTAVDPTMARHIAHILLPDEKNSTAPYFIDAARELVIAVIIALNFIAGNNWDFRDLLNALDSRDHIWKVTNRHPRAKAIAQQILKDDRHSSGVLSTLGSKLGKFAEVAALWAAKKGKRRKFKINEFLSKPGVLILANDPVLNATLQPLNNIALKAISDELLRRPDTNSPRTWILLDEFRSMLKVESISDLLIRGRSKGVSVTIGLQAIEGLYPIYGESETNEFLGQIANKTFLRVGSAKTAQWASDYFNKLRHSERSHSETFGKNPSSSYSDKIEDRPLFLPAYFLGLPFPVKGGRLKAVSDLPCYSNSIFISDRSCDDVWASLKPLGKAEPVIRRYTAQDQTLWPWGEDEEKFYCGDPDSGAGGDTYLPDPPKPPPDDPSQGDLFGPDL